MADFCVAYAPVKKWEGGWCNVKNDAGGETYAGIARNFFPKWKGWSIVDKAKSHPSFKKGSVAFSNHLDSLPGLRSSVESWYKVEWWDKMNIAQLPQLLANEIFEQAINLGRGGAGKLLQRMCNAFNYNRGTKRAMFLDLTVDGAVGPKTLSALSQILTTRKVNVIVHALNALQCTYYLNIATTKKTHRKFLDGWLTRTYCQGESSDVS